ncbi:MAG TPA: site-specific integrase, partial [Alphaproteobacteria bacterium]
MAYIQARKSSNGRTKYRAQVRLKGHPIQCATFERKTDARRWVQQIESAIREGRHFKTSEAKRHSVADLIDRYIETVLPRKERSFNLQLAQLMWWSGQLGARILADLSPAHIVECRDRLATEVVRGNKKRSAGTVNRYLAALSHALSVATREWGWLEASPARHVSKLREPTGRVRFLSDDERTRLLRACGESRNKYLYPAVVVAISTGVRQGELLGLRWEDIDFRRGAIVLHRTKNDERRAVPLVGHALKVMQGLASLGREEGNLVFEGRRRGERASLRTAWQNALRRAEIRNFRFHDLRHSTASYLAMNGASLAEIAEVLGHKTLQMVKRYAHLSDQHTASVVASMT